MKKCKKHLKSIEPDIEVYFNGDYDSEILQKVKKHLREATDRIYIAVAWITRKEIVSILYDKLKEKETKEIKVLISNSKSNNQSYILKLANKILKLKSQKKEFYVWEKFSVGHKTEIGTNIMHHKFCVIDDMVITGSFNWSKNAIFNRENIVIIRKENIVNDYVKEFNQLTTNEHSKKIVKKSVFKKLNWL